MLKIRLIPVLFLMNGLIVRSEKFSYHQFLGNVVDETRRYSEWNIDELIFIDILKSLNIDFVHQKYLEYFCFDFYLTEYDVYIEIDGDYFHCNPNIFDISKKNKMQLRNEKHDIIKQAVVLLIIRISI